MPTSLLRCLGHAVRRLRAGRRPGGARGFSLIEVMVVVMLITLLAALAVPTMGEARKDRMAYELTRAAGALVSTARTRAMARGSAHLVVMTTEGGTEPSFLVFEARDASGRPQSSCRTASQWTVPAGSATSVFLERVDFATAAYANLVGTLRLDGVDVPALVVCATPSGRLYGRTSTTGQAAANLLETAQPFTGVIEIRSRRVRSGVQLGPTRRVLLSASGSPRIQVDPAP